VSQLDYAKEQIAYLKLWLGILIATGISIMSWLLANFDIGARLWWVALVAFAFNGTICFFVHRKINLKIDELRRL
jgi:hypothetical protein